MRSHGIVINYARERRRFLIWLTISTIYFLVLLLLSNSMNQAFSDNQPTWRLSIIYFSCDMQQGILSALSSTYFFSILNLSDRFDKLNRSLEYV